MTVGQAREAARSWVVGNCAAIPGFGGAYTTGSTNWLSEDAILPATSDCDVTVFLEESSRTGTSGKFSYGETILDVAYVRRAQMRPDRVLSDYHLAPGLQSACILVDPSGELVGLQAAVCAQYAAPEWVLRRCGNARDKVLRYLRLFGEHRNSHDRVIALLFAAGITTHILLAAGLRNPTVRKRYVAARDLLKDYGCLSFHEELLEVAGFRRISQTRAARHLTMLSRAYDAAWEALPSAPDINAAARPIAIDGSRELIEGGCHREAMFWIAVTRARSQKLLCSQSVRRSAFAESYGELLADIGLASPADLHRRRARLEHFIPRLWATAEKIMATSTLIVRH
jgi:hypothetical protein